MKTLQRRKKRQTGREKGNVNTNQEQTKQANGHSLNKQLEGMETEPGTFNRWCQPRTTALSYKETLTNWNRTWIDTNLW